MKVKRGFNSEIERYEFDLKHCSMNKGWSQLDTRQDASYFGNWVNPVTLQIVCFAEGDITNTTCADADEFKGELRKAFEFYGEGTKIDAYMNTEPFIALGYKCDEYDCIYLSPECRDKYEV